MAEKLTKKDVIGMVGVIKSNYYYAYKDIGETELSVLIDTWFMLLGKEPKEIVMTAFYKALEHCKMPPTIADIKTEIDAIYEAMEKTDIELWNELKEAMRQCARERGKFQYTTRTADGKVEGMVARENTKLLFNNLDEILKEYVGSYEEFMYLSNSVDNYEFEKARFMKAFKEIKARIKTKNELSQEVKQLAQKNQMLLEDKSE